MSFARRRLALTLLGSLLLADPAVAAPRVIVISLDGATPRLVQEYTEAGALDRTSGLGRLAARGLVARQNTTVSPSLTAPSHIAIATGSTAAHNDIPANTFHLVASPLTGPTSTISGFAAPIGGYALRPHGPTESPAPTAEPLWLALRAAGKSVVTATFPGGDGVDVRVPGDPAATIVQPASKRTVNFTVPFGAFGGIGAQGFTLTAGDFTAAPAGTITQLTAAGRAGFSPIRQKTTPLETFTVGGATFTLHVAALDTTDDGVVNYDTLVFFDAVQGIQPGPFARPATGPAYVKAADARSSPFYLDGSSTRAGTAFYVSQLAPDLATVRLARLSANFIPRNAAVLADVDDINTHVGFWAPQPDFRIPERLSPGFGTFPDQELEAIYADLVTSFVDYQTRVALRGIARVPDADLVMLYIEQPDGSGHQFLLTDRRQPTNIADPNSIGSGQDPAKIARYRGYLQRAYRVASDAVQRIIDAVGTDALGRPRSNVFVVSDHGFAPFHTAVNLNAYLTSRGFNASTVRAITSGPSVNVYINLAGREQNGTVTPAEYVVLQQRLAVALAELRDTNPNYTRGPRPVFDKIFKRPVPADLADPAFGRSTSAVIGQDSGDVFALLTLGYNFDGVQGPGIARRDDPAAATPILSLPNFYGAHGYDPSVPEMSAIFYAAGPDIRHGRLTRVRNVDLAPTIARLLGVEPAPSVDGAALPVRIARKVRRDLINELRRLPLTGDRTRDAAIRRAIDRLRESLADRFWRDDATLGARGAAVFVADHAALQELAKAGAVVTPLARALVAIDEELATGAVDEALEALGEHGHGQGVERAQAALRDAAAARAAGDLARALEHYRRAWQLARRG
jgi:predicted AlkP superfamily pyrophosphatase or phosphodiesterase